MNVNKKLGRFKQWAGEKMGAEAKTDVSSDFKSLEQEMTMRHDGSIHLGRQIMQRLTIRKGWNDSTSLRLPT